MDSETIEALDNLLPFPELVKEVESISKRFKIPLEKLALAALDVQLLVEELLDDEEEEDDGPMVWVDEKSTGILQDALKNCATLEEAEQAVVESLSEEVNGSEDND